MTILTNHKNIKLNEIYHLNNCTTFENDNNVFLFDNISGHSIIFEKNMWTDILNGNIDDGAIFLLNQRGFLSKIFEINPIEEKAQPTFFLINMTDCCNLKCKYCFRDVHEKVVPNISDQEVIKICSKIVEYCHKHNIHSIIIQPWGGEPLIAFPQILVIDEFMKRYDIKYQIVFATNATLITENMAIEMKKRDFHVGISLDGNEKLHNKQRPFKDSTKNSYNSVKIGVKNLYKAGYDNIGSICTVSKINVKHIDQIIDTFVDDFNLHSIKLNFTKANPFSEESKDIAIVEEDIINEFYDKLIAKLITVNESGYHIFERNICDRLQNLLSSNTSNICLSRGCLGGNKMISFNQKGDIFPCEMVDVEEVKMGNVFENKDIIDIIESNKSKNPFFKSKIVDKCNKCSWKVYCAGGCSASVIYNGCENNCCDELECQINKILYPKLINLILNKPDAVFYLSNKLIKII